MKRVRNFGLGVVVMWMFVLKLYPDRIAIRYLVATFKRLVLCGVAGLVVIFIAHADPADTSQPGFATGQMWSIKSARPTTAKVVVSRIEMWNGISTVHVSLIDIPVPQASESHDRLVTIDHVPFNSSALASSVERLIAIKVEPPSGFERGYRNWRTDKNANVFDITVSQVIALMLETIIRDRA